MLQKTLQVTHFHFDGDLETMEVKCKAARWCSTSHCRLTVRRLEVCVGCCMFSLFSYTVHKEAHEKNVNDKLSAGVYV